MNTPQTVIITGGARGIGYGIATRFALQGAKLIIADSDEPGAGSACTELSKIGAADALAILCDVSDRDSVQAMTDAAVSHYGHIDVLVNNAGICPFEQIMEMSPDTWRRTIDVNLTGAFHCTQIAARRLIEQGAGGRIIYITSLAENVAGPAQVDYAASKGGLRMQMVGFATALGPDGITCNAVAPGMILTDMTRHHWEQPGPAEMIKARVPMGRIGTPEDVGKAVVFLASEDAEYINGVSLRVDGGHQAVCN